MLCMTFKNCLGFSEIWDNTETNRMISIQEIQQQSKLILKTQFTLTQELKEIQLAINNQKLKQIIDSSIKNQEQIQQLQNKQNIAEIEIEQIYDKNQSQDIQLKDLKDLNQNHCLEIAKLSRVIEKQNIDFKAKLDSLQIQYQNKCKEFQKRQILFKELQKKVLILSKQVASVNQSDKELIQPHKQLFEDAKGLDYEQTLKQKQNLLKNQKEQIENLKKFQIQDKQKKEARIEQNQTKQLRYLQEQQDLERQNFEQLLKEKENKKILLEKEKNEPKRQEIDKIEDLQKVQKDVNILVINLENEFHVIQSGISEQGAQYISERIKELKNLRDLNLNLKYNDISEQGAQYTSEGIKELKNLTNLKLTLWQLKQFKLRESSSLFPKVAYSALQRLLFHCL
ncbi:hypothetical protein PPERSA_02372 [Pseudocohnilembus persalinus]|uniref:Uncharacterized protein n=1 Tax=Pseudocohnilembus persalinus TaxID=266149 RepID=A0A0V0QV30_PSEPJ|nr:hypothetical protein PPERSA_02372 [Pseudocohnilembus persalinus]|eukprot:KRX05840.1 hypothetical protein PPERSA_02372 [Pseudocohnilembus persalinus]